MSILVVTVQTSHAQWTLDVVESDLDYPWSLAGDFDYDGDPDLVTFVADTVLWYENLLPGWARHTIDPSFPKGSDGTIDVFDMDGDGDMDFDIAGYMDPARLSWYENRMDGTQWREHVIDTTLSGPTNRRISYGDLDNDQDIDVVCSTLDDGRIYWFENVEGDTVWTRHEVASISQAAWTTVGDVMGDSKPDILAASWSGLEVYCYENQLADTTWPRSVIGYISGSAMGECADIDGDFDLDLVTHSVGVGRIYWCENPTWETHIVGYVSDAWLGSIGDLDQDGALDITFGMSTSTQVSRLGWFRNADGDGSNWEEYTVDSSPIGLSLYPTTLADFNADTYPDIVASQLSTGSIGDVRCYLNPAPPTTGIGDELPAGKQIPRR